eukprot:m.58779 g.58779  ORF g.58779 m.58779 type:complete len:86 (+) comp7881_c0_seq2:2009-2266(+)
MNFKNLVFLSLSDKFNLKCEDGDCSNGQVLFYLISTPKGLLFISSYDYLTSPLCKNLSCRFLWATMSIILSAPTMSCTTSSPGKF